MANENRRSLYNALDKAGYDIGNYDDFDRRMNNAEDREKFFTAIGEAGYDIGNRDDFERRISPTKYHINVNGNSVGVSEKEYKDFLSRHPEQKTPTWQEQMQQTIDDAQKTLGENRRTVNRIGNLQQRVGLDVPKTIRFGENRKVTKGPQRLNVKTGKLENTYITTSGNEYESRELADMEQRAIDDAMRRENDPIGTELQDAYNERDRLNKMLEARRQEIEQGKRDEGLATRFMREAGRLAQSDKMPEMISPSADWEQDREYSNLMAAYRKNNALITTLEDQRDKKTDDFWHSFATEAANGYTFSLGGKTRMDDIISLTEAKKHLPSINEKRSKGERLNREEEVAEAVLKNNEWDREIQGKYGDEYGAWARAGKMGANSADFMLDFLMMGGAPAKMAKGIMTSIVKGGEKMLGNVATKGLGRFMLKTTGATLGSMVAGAEITNTIQLGKTASDVAQSMMGDVYHDANGDYIFGHYEEDENGKPKFVEGGNGFFSALAQAERTGISENGSEILGTFLPGAAGVLKELGLSKIARGLTALQGKRWYQNYSKFLQTAGFNGVVGEGLEEYGGMMLDAIMGGDEWKSLGEGRTHLDIWLGVTTMAGVLNAPKLIGTAYSSAQYQRYKQATNKADIAAQATMTADEWNTLRETIDGTDNDGMADVVMSILNNDQMTDEAKLAAMDYVSSLQKMRGYSLGSIVSGRDNEEASKVQDINDGYTEGYNTQVPDEKKQIADEAQAAEASLPEYGEEFAKMVASSENPVETMDYLLNNRDTYTDDQIAAAADYFSKKAKSDGMMDGVLDGIDLQVEEANASIRGNMHQQSGNLIMAKSGDQDYYIIGGDVVMGEDGTIELAGTGGAVIVKDPVTGEVSVKSREELAPYYIQNAEELMQANETVLRQQLMQQAEDDIAYGSPAQEVFDIEDEVVLRDRGGNEIQGTIAMLPNSADGAYVVYTPDNKALQFTAEELNRMVVAHNGQEVERTSMPMPAEATLGEMSGENGERTGENEATPRENGERIGENKATLGENEATPEENGERTGENSSAISRIPVVKDEYDNPILKKGRPQYEWHKASLEDATDALIETTGGDMLMARDTATDLINVAQQKLQQIRKQKIKGEDPFEIAESRKAKQQAEQEQQEIIKRWQDVGTTIRRRMDAEAAEKRAAEEAAKSAEQKAREAEAARQQKEQQDKIAAERRRKKIEEEISNWNKPYGPLTKARNEMAGDPQAVEVLNDVEPRSLEEWVSSLIRPQSMMWDDETDPATGRTIVGLQSELGLQKKDVERIGGLVASRKRGGKPFGQVVHDIWEELPEGIKNMYDDQDVRNTLIGLFGEGNTMRMRHLTEEHRIEEAREIMRENQRRDAEAEMDAWAEAYHLTPEERETFNEWLSLPPSEPEQEVINQIIADNEQNRTSPSMGGEPVSGATAAGVEGSQGEVQQAAEAAGSVVDEEGAAEEAEAGGGEPSVADNDVAGGARSIDRESFRVLLDQIGEDITLADRMSDYEVEQMTAMVEDWEAHNDDYGYVIEQQKNALKDKNKDVREAAQKKVDEAQATANEAFEPIAEYVEQLKAKYGIKSDVPFDGVMPTRDIDEPRLRAIREAMTEAYRTGDAAAIQAAALQVQAYVDEGLDDYDENTEVFDIAESYDGNDPAILTDQYIIRVFWDRYLDDDTDPEYIKTGLKASMRENAVNVGENAAEVQGEPGGEAPGTVAIGKTSSPEEIAAEEAKVDTNPTDGQKEAGNYQKGHINVDGYDITIENPKGSVRSGVDRKGREWKVIMQNTYGYIRGTEGVDGDHIDVFLSDNPTSGKVFVVDQVNPETGEFDEHKVMYGFASADEATRAYLSNYADGWQGFGAISGVEREEFKKWIESSHRKTKPFREYALAKRAEKQAEEVAQKYQTADDIRKLEGKTFVGLHGETMQIGKFRPNKSNKAKDRVEVVFNGNPDTFYWKHLAESLSNEAYWQEQAAPAAGPKAEEKKEPKAKTKKEQPAKKEPKRLVSDDQMEELRKKLIEKFNTLNAGIDVERMLLGAMYAVGKIERGVTKFADYAREMVDEIGDAIRPYLKAFYEAVRNMPEAAEYRDQMTPADEVAAFDEYNFDKQRQSDFFTKAEQVVKKSKAKQQVKKIEKEVNQKLQQGNLFAGDLFGEPGPAKEEAKAQEPAKRKEPKLRPATEADLESAHPVVYLDGHPWSIIAVMHSGEQISATQFSKPRVDSVMLTNGKSVKLEDLMVEDENAGKVEAKPKTAWWSDEKRPKGLNPKDYTTYTTDEAKAYFAQFVGPLDEKGRHFPDFTKWAHPNLAYITAAAWDGAVIPLEELKAIPEIQEADARIKPVSDGLTISDEEKVQHANHLLDAEHGSAVFVDGKKDKGNYSGPVRQERKALIVIGKPAGGKSSVFADRLSYDFGARIVDSDTVKPWLEGFDDGYGAGYVHNASAEVADMALDMAVERGDNMVIPRIGGESVVTKLVIPRLIEKGYDVQLYFNDVSEDSSIMRAASRFAEEGRYLSLDYLTTINDKDYKTFRNFAEKKLSEYYGENHAERPAHGSEPASPSVLADGRSDGRGAQPSRSRESGSVSPMVQKAGQLQMGSSEQQGDRQVADGTRIFSYSEWKSNDVAFGEKPKEIWNSKSGKPMPTKEVKDNGVQSEQRLSGKPSPSGEGERQVSGGTDGAGTELGAEQNRSERSGSGRAVENQPVKPKQELHKNKRNNVGERGKDYAPTSPKARFNANIEAVKMMRALMDDGVEAPTKDQMEELRQYSGWGGLGTYFNDESSAENKLLRDVLTDEEYNDAVMSANSAYYTPAMVIDTLWDIAKAMGFKGGNTLEGSAGIGNIIGQMPREMSRRSDIEAVEIDSISGNILKLLYPDAKVHIQGFEDTQIPNGSVDLAITNVPFVTGLHVFDKVDKDLSRRFVNIHDFCIAKNIRKLKPGGIGIFITSSGTMDKSNDLRAWITSEGQSDVVGAFRMNNETFGGTKVTSDIIVVRKRTAGKSAGAIDVSKASPLRVGTYTDKYGDDKQTTMVINDYFKEHPEMMAGEMAFGYEKGDTFRPGSYALYPVSGKEQEKMLQEFVKTMEQVGAMQSQQQKQVTKEAKPVVENQLTAEKEGRMLVDENGRLCVSQRGVAVPLGLNDQKVKGYSKAECFKDYQAVQQAVDDVLQQQLNDPDDAKLEPKLKALNAAYDKFTKRYGTLHKNTAISFLRNDIDFPSFQALENYKESKDIKGKVTVHTSKAPVMQQRVLGFKTEPKPKSVKDALIASIFRSNGIDLGWITDRLNDANVPKEGGQAGEWTADDVRKGILVSRLGFENPQTGQLEVRHQYLSGNVREKLAQAESYNEGGKYNANIEELKKVVPMDIPAHLIDFSLGSSWIPKELYVEFVKDSTDLRNVQLTHLAGSWNLEVGTWFREEKNRAGGVYSEEFNTTIYAHQLIDSALNNRPYKVAKVEKTFEGSTRTVVDQKATQACNVRIDEIKSEFKEWMRKKMQNDEELAGRIEKIYNDKFNALVPMTIGDEFLPEVFEGANMNISLYGHQKRGVMRGVTSPTMLAHEVGTGKSFTLISTAMEMRRLGTAQKPMIVVQNATVAQMTADAKLLYPNAKILSLSEKDRSAEGRRAFYAKIKFNDWDIIIVPQSTFERIPDSPERELQFIQEKIDEKKHIIEAAEGSNLDKRSIEKLKRELAGLEQEYGDKFLNSDPANDGAGPKRKKKDAKREAASLDKAETRAKEQLDRAVDDVQFFDDLGVDALLVDEAHEYKHLGFQTSIGRGIKGIDPSYSKKCAGLYNKTRCVFEKAGWKNVVFATGTPISNTAAEIWTFMKYLMPADVMRENDIYYFDDFVHNFGSISQMLEFSTSGKFKENTRFAAYVNKPELIRIWSQVADTVLTKEVGKVQEKIPELEGGKDQDVFLPQSPSLVRIMAAVRKELERFEQMSGQQKKENSSIPLTMYGIAKRAAIDPRLVDAEAPDEPMSKTNSAVKEILADLDKTKSYKGTVAVFCDNQNRLGADKSVEFNIFDEMKAKLVKQGVPESEIAVIKSGMSITAKQKIFDAVNAGSIRVIMGSTQTLGTGVNIQERLHLLIHMDAPDRPMDYTQRNGRIKRQGNLHKEWGKSIKVVRFGVEDSLDVTAYQRLKTKSGFIDSIMDGKGSLTNNQVDRTVEEEEEGLFDNPVAVLSGSQYALKKNQAERELRKYQGKKSQWEADQVYIVDKLKRNERAVNDYQSRYIPEEEKLLNHIRSLFPDGKAKRITIEGATVDLTASDADKKLAEVIKEKVNDPVNAIVKRNRENAIYNDEYLKFNVKVDNANITFSIGVVRESKWENGAMHTVIHRETSYKSEDLKMQHPADVRSFKDGIEEILTSRITGQRSEDAIARMKEEVERLKAESEQMQGRVGQPFQFGKELEEAEKRVEEYTALMKKEMEEKEAKYAEQAKEAGEDGGFDLRKAEDSEDDELYRQAETFAEGELFPIHTNLVWDGHVLKRDRTYSVDLMPDEYATEQQLLDGLRRQYPEYYVSIVDGNVRFESWESVMQLPAVETSGTMTKRAEAGKKSYIERKTRNAIAAVTSLAEAMHLDVEVKTDLDGLVGKQRRAKGFFNRQTGKITLVLPNHRNQSDLINTLLHEGVAHAGLRKMFGANFDTFLDNVYENVSPEIRDRIKAAMKRNGWSRHEATEEYLARLAERTDFDHASSQGWWQKIKDFFIELLTRAGLRMSEPITDDELRYILWRSYDNLLHPGRRSIFDKAKDVQMQSRLKVGAYADDVRLMPTGLAADPQALVVGLDPLYRKFREIKSKYPDALILFKMQDGNYKAIGEDVSPVGSAFGRGAWGNNSDTEYNIPADKLDILLPRLVRNGYRIAIVDGQQDNVANDVLLNSTDYASDEINAIVDKAKADGTYMLAPNGKPSNLNELQWAQVRTQAFKDWFGDWEKAAKEVHIVPAEKEHGFTNFADARHWAKQNIVRTYSDEETGGKGKIQISGRAVEKFMSEDAVTKSDSKDVHMSVLKVLPSVIHDGMVGESHPDYKKVNGARSVENGINEGVTIHRVFGAVDIDGQIYRVKITLKEDRTQATKTKAYSYEATKIELLDGLSAAPVGTPRNSNSSITAAKLLKDIDKSHKKGEKLLDYSKVVDENGEPKVMYHGTNLTQVNQGEPFWTFYPDQHFGTQEQAGDRVSYNTDGVVKIYEVFLNIRNPHRRQDADQEYLEEKDITMSEYWQLMAERSKGQGYDGIVYLNEYEGEIPEDSWIAFNPNQIKSATDNVGTFMTEDNDIRYSDPDAWLDDVARDTYEAAVAKDSLKWQEAWQDSMVSLKAIQDAIAKETGNVAKGAEDAYRFENRMHGRSKNRTEQYDWRYYRPMLKAFNDFIKAKDMTFEAGQEYLIAKHGLERNVYYAMRDAVKEKLVKEVADERKKLEKKYKEKQIAEKSYKEQLNLLAKKEQTGVDDRIKQIRETLAYQRAKEDYEDGNIGYTEYLRRIESIIKSHVGGYDTYAHDYSGLTETFAKEWYDDAQDTKRQAQRAIDPKTRAMLWKEYDRQMKEAYEVARGYAEDAVFSAETTPSGEAEATVAKLWKAINAATEATLKDSYESGLMSRDTYNKVRDMFEYYVPLRGWEEDKASDVYEYMGKDNVFSPAVKKTWGRTSKAENPLAYIGNIAVSTIISGHRNLMKQHFLNYVMNNPTSLVSISESWYENIGSLEEPIWIYRSADTAGKSPDEVTQIVNDFNEEMAEKQREGYAMPVRGRLRLDVNATKGQKSEHVVEVQRAGRTYELYINGNPKAAQALNGSAARAVKRLSDTDYGKWIKTVNRNMAMFFTSKNPAFVISNLSRDLNMAGASVAVNEGAKYNAKFIANVAKVLSPRMAVGDVSKMGLKGLVGKGRGLTAMMPKLMQKWKDGKLNESDETERLFKEFMDEGGETGFVNMLSIDSFKEKMKKEIGQMNGSSLLGKSKGQVKEAAITKGLRLLGDTFEFYNRCAEDATRFIVYMTSRQMGKTLEESIADAKDVTLNFNRKGTGEKWQSGISDAFIFVNPAIQALANMYRMAKGHPLKFTGVTLGFVAFGVMMPILNSWLLNMFGGDDDKDSYWNLPPWVRKNNLVFWVPGTSNFVTIPLAQEFRVFYGVGEMIASYCLDHPHNNGVLEIVESVADLVPINPTGNGGNLVVDFSPTLTQPILQLAFNTDFTGKPIWKDNQGNKFDPMYSKAYVSTPKWMVAVSDAVNNVTGGDEDSRGWMERTTAGAYLNNPAVWNHLLQGYFGGMYNTIAKTFDVATTAAQGDVPKVYQTPILNRFVNRPLERDNAGVLGEDYWNLVESTEEMQHNIRKKRQRAADGDEAARQELERLLQSTDGKRAEVVSYYKGIIDVLRKGEKNVSDAGDKRMFKESITNWKEQMLEEIQAIEDGRDPMEVIMEQFDKSRNAAERKKLQNRINRMMTEQKSKGASADVEKAMQFVEADDADSQSVGSDRYIELATAQNIKDDARIKAAKSKIKVYSDKYKSLQEEGKTEEAAAYRQQYAKYFAAETTVNRLSRAVSGNKKLLGKGHDEAVMKLIGSQRNAMLKAIEAIDK